MADAGAAPEQLVDRRVPPAEEALLRDEWETLLCREPAVLRQLLTLLGEGHTQVDAAQLLSLHVKAVRRVIDRLKARQADIASEALCPA